MYFKILHNNSEGKPIFARVDDDGLYRLTCVAEHPELQAYLKNGGELQDADGNLMSPEQAKAYVATLP